MSDLDQQVQSDISDLTSSYTEIKVVDYDNLKDYQSDSGWKIIREYPGTDSSVLRFMVGVPKEYKAEQEISSHDRAVANLVKANIELRDASQLIANLNEEAVEMKHFNVFHEKQIKILMRRETVAHDTIHKYETDVAKVRAAIGSDRWFQITSRK